MHHVLVFASYAHHSPFLYHSPFLLISFTFHSPHSSLPSPLLSPFSFLLSSLPSPLLLSFSPSLLIPVTQVGEDRLIRFSGCKSGSACSIILRGASSHLLDEAERSLHDALCVLTETVKETR